MRLLREERGFTVSELLVAISLTFIVFGAAVGVFAAFAHQKVRSDNQTEAQAGARKIVDRIATQLRSAMAANANGSQPVEQHASYDMVFLAPLPSATTIRNARGLSHVRYCLDASDPNNEVLWMQTASFDSSSQPAPPSTASCPGTAWPNQQMVANQLVNQIQAPAKPLFSFTLDSAGAVTDVAMAAVLDADPTAAPPSTTLQTSVTLRNLNHAPTAAISCQALSNGHAVCDASASSDIEGQEMTYAWTMDGNALAATTYHLDQPGLASGSTHAFAVTVTDSGGLTSSASQSVRMP